ERFINAMVFWNVLSVLAWEIHFYVVYITLLVVELWIAMRADLVRLRPSNTLKGKVARLLTFKNSKVNEETAASDHKWLKVLGIIGIYIMYIVENCGIGDI